MKYAYNKNTKLQSIVKGYVGRFSLYVGRNQRVLTEEQEIIKRQIAYIYCTEKRIGGRLWQNSGLLTYKLMEKKHQIIISAILK